MGNTPGLEISCYPVIHRIFLKAFLLFLFPFLSILSLLETRQSTPAALLKAPVWEMPKVLLGNTPGYCGEYHK